MVMVKHFQSSQKSNFAVSLQFLKNKASDAIDFWHAVKHQSFLQVDFNNWRTQNHLVPKRKLNHLAKLTRLV